MPVITCRVPDALAALVRGEAARRGVAISTLAAQAMASGIEALVRTGQEVRTVLAVKDARIYVVGSHEVTKEGKDV